MNYKSYIYPFKNHYLSDTYNREHLEEIKIEESLINQILWGLYGNHAFQIFTRILLASTITW